MIFVAWYMYDYDPHYVECVIFFCYTDIFKKSYVFRYGVLSKRLCRFFVAIFGTA